MAESLKELVALSNSIEERILDAIATDDSQTLESIADEMNALSRKADSCAVVIDKLTQAASYWKDRAITAQRVSKSIEANCERLKGYIKQTLLETGNGELVGTDYRFKISVQKDAKLVINTVPEQYKIVVSELVADKERIESDLREGKQIEGCSLADIVTLRKYPNTKGKK